MPSQDGQKMDTGMLCEWGFMGAEKILQYIPLQKLRATNHLGRSEPRRLWKPVGWKRKLSREDEDAGVNYAQGVFIKLATKYSFLKRQCFYFSLLCVGVCLKSQVRSVLKIIFELAFGPLGGIYKGDIFRPVPSKTKMRPPNLFVNLFL